MNLQKKVTKSSSQDAQILDEILVCKALVDENKPKSYAHHAACKLKFQKILAK